MVAGALLVGLAAPRAIAAALLLPYESTVPRLARGEVLVAPELAPAIAAHRQALAWYDSARLRQRLGQLSYALAQASREPGARAAALAQAAAAHEAALRRNPRLPFAWTQLALIRMELEGPGAAFDSAFARAVAVAPALPTLVFARVRVGLVAWPLLAPTTRELVAGQTAVAAALDPQRLAGLATATNRVGLLRRLLAAAPADLRRVDRLLRRPVPPRRPLPPE